jgi:hypothetical protein
VFLADHLVLPHVGLLFFCGCLGVLSEDVFIYFKRSFFFLFYVLVLCMVL